MDSGLRGADTGLFADFSSQTSTFFCYVLGEASQTTMGLRILQEMLERASERSMGDGPWGSPLDIPGLVDRAHRAAT